MMTPDLQAEIDQAFSQALEPLRADIDELRASGPSSAPLPIVVPPTTYAQAKRQPPALFIATADATWNGTTTRWEVAAERVNTAGTSGSPGTFVCVGASGDDTPVLDGDLCVEVMSRDNQQVLVPLGRSEVWGALGGTPGWVLGKMTVDGETTVGWVEAGPHADEHPESA